MSEISERIKVAKANHLHPLDDELEEGTHYEVLAYTDWADMFIPTMVEWANGETDSLLDPEETLENRIESVQLAQA